MCLYYKNFGRFVADEQLLAELGKMRETTSLQLVSLIGDCEMQILNARMSNEEKNASSAGSAAGLNCRKEATLSDLAGAEEENQKSENHSHDEKQECTECTSVQSRSKKNNFCFGLPNCSCE